MDRGLLVRTVAQADGRFGWVDMRGVLNFGFPSSGARRALDLAWPLSERAGAEYNLAAEEVWPWRRCITLDRLPELLDALKDAPLEPFEAWSDAAVVQQVNLPEITQHPGEPVLEPLGMLARQHDHEVRWLQQWPAVLVQSIRRTLQVHYPTHLPPFPSTREAHEVARWYLHRCAVASHPGEQVARVHRSWLDQVSPSPPASGDPVAWTLPHGVTLGHVLCVAGDVGHLALERLAWPQDRSWSTQVDPLGLTPGHWALDHARHAPRTALVLLRTLAAAQPEGLAWWRQGQGPLDAWVRCPRSGRAVVPVVGSEQDQADWALLFAWLDLHAPGWDRLSHLSFHDVPGHLDPTGDRMQGDDVVGAYLRHSRPRWEKGEMEAGVAPCHQPAAARERL